MAGKISLTGDWIPYDVTLPEKIEVIRIATATGRSISEVVGTLMMFWGWVSNVSHDGFIHGVILKDLDSKFGPTEDFWSQVMTVGWLLIEEQGIRIPNAEWLKGGRKSRKKKSMRSERNKRYQEKKKQKKIENNNKTKPINNTAASLDNDLKIKDQIKDLSPTTTKVDNSKYSSVLDEIKEAWNATAKSLNLKPIHKISNERRKHLLARLRDPDWDWRAALKHLPKAKFALGEGKDGWIITFDFFIKPDSVLKLLEGKYDQTVIKKESVQDILRRGATFNPNDVTDEEKGFTI